MNILKPLTIDKYPGLPKWPGAFVTGKSVTPEQAKDIIFRTDPSVRHPSEYMGGNDRLFRARCVKKFGWQPILDAEGKWFELNKIEDQAQKEAAIEALCPKSSGYRWPARLVLSIRQHPQRWPQLRQVAESREHRQRLDEPGVGLPVP